MAHIYTAQDMGTLGIKEAVAEGRVKQHVFHPSGRQVWTVVGRKAEHWVDPHRGYCTCPAYYFGGPAGVCYHIKCQGYANSTSSFDTIKFHDEEFGGFVAGLVDDTLAAE